ncbi:MAG: copper chaperone PCu(A)C [Silicimonas sp.]|nr:copper chaperone PCu(A)C [Silicimonas sp.]
MKTLRTALFFAATLTLGAAPFAAAEGMKHAHDMAASQPMEHQVGDLTLSAAFSRETLPNQPVAGAFLTITNNGSEDDVLIAVSSPLAARGEVHEMAMEGDTMKMRPLADGLVIPAGATVELQPGGYHLMFMGLNQSLVEGEMVDVTLEFRNAGAVAIPFSILGKGAKSMDHSGHGS